MFMDRRVRLLIRYLDEHQYAQADNLEATGYYMLNAEDRKSLTDELARIVGLSPSRVRHLFLDYAGMTPERYFKQMKLQKARELAETTNLKVYQITEKIGVADHGHFLREFKTTYGLTMKQCRKRAAAPPA